MSSHWQLCCAAGRFAATVAAVLASEQYAVCMWTPALMPSRQVVLLQAMTIGMLAAEIGPLTKATQDCMYSTLQRSHVLNQHECLNKWFS